MPTRLIEEQDSVRPGRDLFCDFGQVQVHRRSVAAWQNERRAFALLRADRAEDIGRRRALVLRRERARAALGPSARDLVLLADARLVAEPDLYVAGVELLLLGDRLQPRGKFFLNSSIAPSACA